MSKNTTVLIEAPVVTISADRRTTAELMVCPSCKYGKTPAEVIGEKDVELRGGGVRHEAELRCPNCLHEWHAPAEPGVAVRNAGSNWIGKLPSAS
jgi:hypothetical protein